MCLYLLLENVSIDSKEGSANAFTSQRLWKLGFSITALTGWWCFYSPSSVTVQAENRERMKEFQEVGVKLTNPVFAISKN